MFLKRRVRKQDGKEHVHYALCESLRVHSGRVVQRQVLHLGEMNTTQTESWQRTLEIVNEEDGARLQRRLFTDRDGAAPPGADDVVEVRLSSLRVRAPRRFGDCWAGCRLWRELGLDEFWRARLGGARGEVPWEKVVELRAVNRLRDPRSELFVHEKWFPQTAMDGLLDCDFAVAEKIVFTAVWIASWSTRRRSSSTSPRVGRIFSTRVSTWCPTISRGRISRAAPTRSRRHGAVTRAITGPTASSASSRSS